MSSETPDSADPHVARRQIFGKASMLYHRVVEIALAVCVLMSGNELLAFTTDFSGPVISVLDGKRSKQAASELVFGKEVTLNTFGKDKYGRTIADVLLPDGTNVNHELVKEGWCWWYRKYAPGNVVLEELERRARGAGLGLWADSAPIPPWEWRKARRESLAEVN